MILLTSVDRTYNRQTFKKAERLKSDRIIRELFRLNFFLQEGKLRLHFLSLKGDNIVPSQFLVVAPKRHFPEANDRNYIKRCIREAVRKEKNTLNTILLEQKKKMAFAITYTGRQRPDSAEIHKGIIKLFNAYLAQL